MKKVRVEDAVGMTLCHDITAIDDHFKGAAFHRGQVITQEDVEKLKNIGKTTSSSGKKTPVKSTRRMRHCGFPSCVRWTAACIPVPAREKWCRRRASGACSG